MDYFSLLKPETAYDSDSSIMPLQFPILNNMKGNILSVSFHRNAQIPNYAKEVYSIILYKRCISNFCS